MRGLLRTVILHHTLGAENEKSTKKAIASNTKLDISYCFPLYVAVSLFSLYLHISVSLSVSCSVFLANYHSLCACNIRSSTRLRYFLCPFYFLEVSCNSLVCNFSSASCLILSFFFPFPLCAAAAFPPLWQSWVLCLLDRDVTRELYLLD